jgi:Fe-S-cluster containining protein
MPPLADELKAAHRESAVLRPRLIELLAAMDRAYATTAAGYGFHCGGCADNCCRTLFFHHTALEYGYLREGFAQLPQPVRTAARKRAETVCAEIAANDDVDGPVRGLCPLNVDERCVLYSYRPMICRLHGIPHELHPPGRQSVFGPGCNAFIQRCGHRSPLPFDRTPFYRRMALLEQELRQSAGVTGKIKATVAEMILTF